MESGGKRGQQYRLCGGWSPRKPAVSAVEGPKPSKALNSLAARNGPYDNKRLRPRRNRIWQRRVRRFMRQIFFAREKAQKRTALERVVVADSAAQHGVARLKRIQHGALRDRAMDFDRHLAPDVGQSPEVLWK